MRRFLCSVYVDAKQRCGTFAFSTPRYRTDCLAPSQFCVFYQQRGEFRRDKLKFQGYKMIAAVEVQHCLELQLYAQE